MLASDYGHKDTVTALVAAGADVNMENNVSAAAVCDEGWDCVHVCGGICVCVRVSVVCRGSYVFINISQTCNKIKIYFCENMDIFDFGINILFACELGCEDAVVFL